MATTYKARLVGGPCDGRTVTLTQAQWDSGETSCKGETYVFDGIIRPSGQLAHFTFRAGAPPPPPPGGGVSGAGVAPQAYQGWGGLRRSLNQELPAALRAINRNQHAALRELAHRRRVNR